MAYSTDLRQIAIAKVQDEKQSKSSVARFLCVNRHTVGQWINIARGLVIPKVRPSDRSSDKTKLITDYVDLNPDKSLLEMEVELGFSDTSIGYHLKKAGYSFKKNKKLTKKKTILSDKNI